MVFTAKIFIKLKIFDWYYIENFCIEYHTNRSSNVGSVGRLYVVWVDCMYGLKYCTIATHPILTKHMHARQNFVKKIYSKFHKNIFKV